MAKYKSREEAWEAYNKMGANEWFNWVYSLSVPARMIKTPLYHISFNRKLEGMWEPMVPAGTSETHTVDVNDIKHEYDERLAIMCEITPPAISTSSTLEGCWYGLYLNIDHLFKEKSHLEEYSKGEAVIYVAKPKPNARILTPEVLHENFLVWDAYMSDEHRILDPCYMELSAELLFNNTMDYPDHRRVFAMPFNKTYDDMDVLYPPFEPISIDPIKPRSKRMNIYSTESFEIQVGTLKMQTSNAEIMKQISMEASLNPINLLHKGLRDKFLILLDNINNLANDTLDTLSGKSSFKLHNLKLHQASKVIKKDYTSLMSMNLDVPEGFKGPYTPYATLVLDTLKDFKDLSTSTTKPCVQTLSIYLSNPEKLKSLSIDISKNVDAKHKTVDSFKESISKYFDTTSVSNVATFGQLFGNNSDFITAARIAKDIENHLTDSKTRRDLVAVQNDINDISNIVDKLIVRSKQDANTYGFNAHTAKTLAEGIEAVAETITFYGALLHMAEEIHGAMYLACNKLK